MLPDTSVVRKLKGNSLPLQPKIRRSVDISLTMVVVGGGGAKGTVTRRIKGGGDPAILSVNRLIRIPKFGDAGRN